MSSNETLFSLLKKMIDNSKPTFNSDDIFDEGVLKYVLGRIPEQELISNDYFSLSLRNYKVKTNLFGYLKYINEIYKTPEKNFERDEIYKKWENIFQEVYPAMLRDENIFYKIINGKTEQERSVSLQLLNFLYNPLRANKNLSVESFTSDEQFIFVEDLTHENQNYVIYKISLTENNALINNIIEMIINNYEKVRLENKKKPKEMLSRAFSSKNFKVIISQGHKDLGLIFDKTLLNDIQKKSDLSDSLSDTPYLLSSIMPIASPEDWLGNNNVLDFFSVLLKRISGYNIKDISSALKSNSFTAKNVNRYSLSAMELMARLEYLEPVLKSKVLSDRDLEIWYGLIMKSNSEKLFKKSLDIFPLPTRKLGIFYDMWFDSIINKNENKTWAMVEKEHLMESLNNKLSTQDIKLKKIKV